VDSDGVAAEGGRAGGGGSVGTTLGGAGGSVDAGASSSTSVIVTLSSGLSNPVAIAVDATSAYFTNYNVEVAPTHRGPIA
jgi:hypothetical protein